MKVLLRDYLKELDYQEWKRRPEGGRNVPSLAELAKAVKVSRATINRLAFNQVLFINMAVVDGIVDELRRRGFEPKITDLLSLDNGHESEAPQ